jgi:hypothetical protein
MTGTGTPFHVMAEPALESMILPSPFMREAIPGSNSAQRRVAHGVPVTVETYPVAAPAFHLYWSFLPEAAEALDAIAPLRRRPDRRRTTTRPSLERTVVLESRRGQG